MLAKSKKSLVFADLIFELPLGEDIVYKESFSNEHLFLIFSQGPWYGDIIIYLQPSKFPPITSKDEHRRLRHLAKNYAIIGGLKSKVDINAYFTTSKDRCTKLSHKNGTPFLRKHINPLVIST